MSYKVYKRIRLKSNIISVIPLSLCARAPPRAPAAARPGRGRGGAPPHAPRRAARRRRTRALSAQWGATRHRHRRAPGRRHPSNKMKGAYTESVSCAVWLTSDLVGTHMRDSGEGWAEGRSGREISARPAAPRRRACHRPKLIGGRQAREVRACWRPRHVLGAVAARGARAAQCSVHGATRATPSAKGSSSMRPRISAASRLHLG